MTNNYVTLAVLKAKKGKRAELRDELLKLIDPTRKEEGCLEYILFEDRNQIGTFYMREVFANDEAFKAHLNTKHFILFKSQINELMTEPILLIELSQISD